MDAGTPPLEQRRFDVGGIEAFARVRGGGGVPTVYVHGNPTHSADWLPFIERIEGPAVALDLPNFGRSERVDPDRFRGDMWSLSSFVGAALDELGVGEHRLVVHDWGGIALHTAQARAESVAKLVLINSVPLSGAYRWHWLARIWRRRPLGELFNATTSRPAVAMLLRQARPGWQPMPEEFVDMVWDCWDAATASAVLRLYRSADPRPLERAGAGLGRLRCPALVVWGQDDPYLAPEWGRLHALRLPHAELLELERAGHWPWIDRPETIDRVADFLR
jgi:pimeloyl-ACP methyl ester carboxylesterase